MSLRSKSGNVKPHCKITIFYSFRDFIYPGFPEEVPVLWGSEGCAAAFAKFGSGTQMSQVFPNHKKEAIRAMDTGF
jgi:hypothetical protein